MHDTIPFAWHEARQPWRPTNGGCGNSSFWSIGTPHLHVGKIGVGSSCFGINKPRIAQLVAIGIAAVTRIENNGLADLGVEVNRRRSGLAVHFNNWIVICVSEVSDGPIHARGEVVLVGVSPTPDRRLI